MRIGSLFSGYGGLDMGAQAVIGGDVVWHVEFDAAPSKILAHHWPTVPNYGDITTVDWSQVEPVDVLTGGFPCQDLSLAGRRAGMRPGTRSGLWGDFLKAIDVLRPGLVVIENVRGLLSGCAESDLEPCPGCVAKGVKHRPVLRALGRVLGDLADFGYDAEWCGIRAADAGAPHPRYRVFIVASDTQQLRREGGRQSAPGQAVGWGTRSVDHRPVGASVSYASGFGGNQGDTAAGRGHQGAHGASVVDERAAHHPATGVVWGEWEPAVRQWERILGRSAPFPTVPTGREGRPRGNPGFGEWMMGLPAGWVTSPEIGLTWQEQWRAIGNGVVPQQAELALRMLLQRNETEVAA